MRELLVKWEGSEHRCRVTHDLIMQIENKVCLQELAQRLANGIETGAIPTSHMAWLYYCVLRASGVLCTSDQVWDVVRDNRADPSALNTIIEFLFAEVFGSGPENTEALEQEKKP